MSITANDKPVQDRSEDKKDLGAASVIASETSSAGETKQSSPSANSTKIASSPVAPRNDEAIPKDTPAQEIVEKPYVPQKDQPVITPLTEKIMKTTFTKNQLLRRVRLLNDFISFRLFTPEGSQSKELREQIMKFFAAHTKGNAGQLNVIAQEADWLNSLEESFFSRFTKENFNVAFDELEKELKGAVPVILYLPFFMPENEQQEIGNWFKKNVASHMLFETNFNPNLVGGCAISYRGEMRDYSVLGQIEANKQIVLDNLKTFKK